jgi:hypothetical protein
LGDFLFEEEGDRQGATNQCRQTHTAWGMGVAREELQRALPKVADLQFDGRLHGRFPHRVDVHGVGIG